MIRAFKEEWFKIAASATLFAGGIAFGAFHLSVPQYVCLILSLAVSGAGVFLDAIKGILRLDFLDEKFLMSLASIGAFAIGECVEGAAVMLFFTVGEYFEHKAVRRSRGSIRELMDICPDTACVLHGAEEITLDAEDVEIGDIIIVRSGERVPLDAKIIDGSCSLDTSMLTGESVPRDVSAGDIIESGTIVIGGLVKATVIHTQENSAASRVLELVECATERKSREENFITKFSRYYTPAVIILALLMSAIPPLLGILSFTDAFYRALSFLVVSCPCALVISVPMAFFGGIGGSASRGILYKGGNTFSAVSHPENIVFDKTGTLTYGRLIIDDVRPYGISASELLLLAASAESASRHLISEALRSACGELLDVSDASETPGLGVSVMLDGVRVLVGNDKLLLKHGIIIPDDIPRGAVLVARSGEYVGYITFKDEIKAEALRALADLRTLGVKKMYILSGDNESGVAPIAESLGIDEYRSSLLPENKFEILEEIIKNSKGSTVYVGDGINDAPCLGRADVGIAMGTRGSDAAIESADAVIMSDNLDRLPDTVRIARKTLRIAKQNIFFAIGVKLSVILLVSLNMAGMWMAVFADVGVAVLAILNAMRTLVFSKRK